MKKSVFSALLAGAFVFAAGCGGTTPTSDSSSGTSSAGSSSPLTPVSEMPVFEDDGSYEFYIGAWNYPSQTDIRAMQYMAECGINHAMMSSVTTDTQTMRAIIENAAQYGVQVYPQMANKSIATAEEFFHGDFDDYLDNPGLAGFCYYDEPMGDKFDALIRIAEDHNENYPDLDFFVNLYSSFYYDDFPDQNTASSYFEYVSMYCSKVLSKIDGKRILSADHYPMRWNKSTQSGMYIDFTWLQTCEAIAENAKAYGAMPHFYLTSTEHYDYRKPTETRLRFEMNVYMTYGAQGLSHFGYAGDESGSEPRKFENSMVSGNGLTKRPFYDTAKKLNHEVLAWDHVFLRYDWQGVMNVLGEGNDSNVLFDNTMLSMSYLPCLDFVTASGDTIIGYFTDENGQPAYMVTNIGDPDRVTETDVVQMQIGGATDALVYHRGESSAVEGDNGLFTLELGPGEAMFLIPVNLAD